MAIERTISIIKPDAVGKNVIGKIYSRFEENGLKIVAAKMKQLTLREAQEFYAVHKDRPFYAGLVEFMTGGPVMIQVLEGENAVLKNRELMGRPIPPKPPKVRYGQTLPHRSALTPYTVPTAWKMPLWKLPISSAKPKSAPVDTPSRPFQTAPGVSMPSEPLVLRKL